VIEQNLIYVVIIIGVADTKFCKVSVDYAKGMQKCDMWE